MLAFTTIYAFDKLMLEMHNKIHLEALRPMRKT